MPKRENKDFLTIGDLTAEQNVCLHKTSRN